MPDTPEYLARIQSYAKAEDPLELQARTPAILEDLVTKASEDKLMTRPSPDKWSVGEILAHLAEDEIATACQLVAGRDSHANSRTLADP